MRVKCGLLCVFLSLLLVACTDGGNDSDSDGGSLSRNVCGDIGLGTRIITGSECTEDNSPVVEISLDLPDGRGGTCSGTMITNQHVLTAAHCFFERPIRAAISAGGVFMGAESVAVHPGVRVDDAAKSVFNDIAILKLSSPVSLPTLPIVGSRTASPGEVIKIYGYGQTEDQSNNNNTVGVLRSGEMRVSGSSVDFVDAPYNGEGSNTCFGDSGGPALISVNGRLGVVGITSSGALLNCGEGDLSRFANVQSTSNLDFITSIVPGVGVL